MSYLKQLEDLRVWARNELAVLLPKNNNDISLLNKHDLDSREDVPIINIFHKHGLFSDEYVLAVQMKDKNIVVVCEDSETKNWASHDIDELATDELCEIADKVVGVVNAK